MSPDRITLSTQGRIESWRGIAAFFGRDERTVQRWEKERLLPVHRADGERGSVFAYKSELLVWLHAPAAPRSARGSLLQQMEGMATLEEPMSRGPDTQDEKAKPFEPLIPQPVPTARGRWFFWLAAAGFALFLLGADTVHARMETAPTPKLEPAAATVPSLLRDASGWPAVATSQTPARKEARTFYLRGRYFLSRRTSPSISKAVDSFTQAIVQDATFAPAYAGLAETYELMPEYSSMPVPEAFPRAIAAAQRAIALDPASAEAHRALAFGLFYWEWKVSDAFAEFRRASLLDPVDAETHHWYATALFTLRRSSEAKLEIERARELDPTSRAILADQILIDAQAGVDRRQCLDSLRELQQSEPDFSSPPRYISSILLETSDYPGWIAQLNRTAASSHSPSDLVLARAAERGWQRGGERALFEELRKAQGKQFMAGQTSGYDLALTCIHLGDKAAAVHYLQSAYQAHDFRLLSLLHDPPDAALRSYAPYEELRQAVEQRMSTSS